MSQTNIATIGPTLNQAVSDLQTQFENQKNAYTSIAKRKKRDFVNGKGERVPNHLRRATGVTAGTEGFSFNTPGNPTYDDMWVYPAEVALPYELTDRVIRNLNAGSEYTQIDGISGYLAKIADALTKNLERITFGDGSGLKGTAASASSSTITFRTAAASSFGSTKGAVWVELGETYDLINGSTRAVRGQVRFSSKTATTATGTFVGFVAADVTDGDFIVETNSLDNFPRGLAYIVNNDTGNFQLLSRATYPELKANVVDLANAAITVSDFDQAVSLLEIRGDTMDGAMEGITCWLPVSQWAALKRLGQNLKRFGPGDTKFDGSFQSFGFGNLTFNKAVDTCEDRIYFNKSADIFKIEEKEFGAYETDGIKMYRKMGTNGVGSTANVGAIGVAYQNGASQPRNYSLIKRAATSALPTQVLAYT